ncbi:MAG: polyprenol monophosphomannose synthase [Aeromicrobium sp.]
MSDVDGQGDRVLVIIPTYDERDNIETIIDRTLAASERHHVLVVDDGSPDGTGDLVENIAASNERVDVLHRSGKLGLGSAYILGFGWGLERGFELLVEMDADGSHAPESLPGMVQQLGPDGSLVIGSRWVPGGAVVDWPLSRQLLSRGGNGYARLALGIHVNDATAGFRVYRADILRRIDLTSIDSKGYCFQIDMTLRVLDAGGSIAEHPITFRERERGESKMSRSIVAEAMWKVTLWGVARRFRRLARRR